ncbi:MAG: nitrogenase molybdenum-iron protein subunit beta [Chthoniobacterales bacterium]|nr:nitrogenase molybdenum-iron protein subunit beta [Chthoniobacterales bacterium]MCX7714016.1 nitrogenase molybdenum-iron protein subunit beta [Chthoniobacterales bacterium]
MLDATPTQLELRNALVINPAKTCQPIGAMYAALGIHGCMPHSHGSQGCCAYHRSQLTRHFKEPVVATTSSFTEGASVFGGLANLQQALVNIFAIYNPDIVAIHTTCLSEVIGDDIPTIIKKSREEGLIPEGKVVIHANTPSFVGSNVTGFSNMCIAIVNYLAEQTGEPTEKINVFPGWLDPSDMREIKRLATELGVVITLCPDTSDVLDLPQTGIYEMYPRGGTPLADIRRMGDAPRTIALGKFTAHPAAEALLEKCGVPYNALDAPIGLANTDLFLDALRKAAGVEVPSSIEAERGRLLDAISDMGQYFYGVPVAIYGDPDVVLGILRFTLELGMEPKYVFTGATGKAFETRAAQLLEEHSTSALVKSQADLFELHQRIKGDPVQLLIGNSHGKHIARAENIPLVRAGFPILDRVGHRLFPMVGYRGAMRLLEQISNALLDFQDRTCPEEKFELVQ